jgi:hypothetical protein
VAGIKIREFARRDGCDDKLVRRAIAKGNLKTLADGTLDEKLVGSGWRKTNRKNASADTADKAADTPKGVRTTRDSKNRQTVEREPLSQPAPLDVETLKDFIDQILRGDFVAQGEAEKVKENALALKHLLDGRQKAGELVSLEEAQTILFETFRAARDAWLNFPTKVGPLIAAELGVDAERVVEALSPHVHQQLTDLGEPDADFSGSA